MDGLIGKTLGPYQILEQIGRGGMATVYKAYQPGLDRYVAVKVLPAHLAEAPGFAQRFQREAKAVGKLEHPHILPVHDFGQQDDLSYLVMRYLEGGTLKGLLGKPLPLDRAAQLIEEIAQALDCAHKQGVVHRDVKPANVLLDAEGRAFLTDFGVARIVEATQQLTGTGVGVGTPAYMSPEQGQGRRVDHRSDIYSLGVVLYEMLTGRVPYEGETPVAVVWKHVNEPLPLPRQVSRSIPEGVERVILKALAKRPEDRYQKAGQMAEALRTEVRATQKIRVLDKEPAQEVIAEPVARPSGAGGLRRFWWIIPLALGSAIAGALIARVPPSRPQATATREAEAGILPTAEPLTPSPVSPTEVSPTRETAAGILPTVQPVTPMPLQPPFVCTDPLGCVTVPPNEPIRLGYLLTVGGPDQALGIDSKRGIEIAIADQGKLLGREIALVGEDDGCNVDTTRAAALRLREDTSVVAIIGTSCSSGARAVALILSDAGFTMVSPSNTALYLTDPAEHVAGYLRVSVSDEFQAHAAARFAYDHLGARGAATIHVPGEWYSEGIAAAFREAFSQLGGEVIETGEMASGATNAAELIREIGSRSPDLIYFPLFYAEAAQVATAIRETPGLEKAFLMGTDALTYSDFLKTAGSAAEGLYITAPALNYDAPDLQKFLAEYEARYGEKPISGFHAQAYDAAMLIFAAVERVPVVDPDGAVHIRRQALRDALYAIRDFKGLSGTLTCQPNGECGEPHYEVLQVKNGKFVSVDWQ